MTASLKLEDAVTGQGKNRSEELSKALQGLHDLADIHRIEVEKRRSIESVRHGRSFVEEYLDRPWGCGGARRAGSGSGAAPKWKAGAATEQPECQHACR